MSDPVVDLWFDRMAQKVADPSWANLWSKVDPPSAVMFAGHDCGRIGLREAASWGPLRDRASRCIERLMSDDIGTDDPPHIPEANRYLDLLVTKSCGFPPESSGAGVGDPTLELLVGHLVDAAVLLSRCLAHDLLGGDVVTDWTIDLDPAITAEQNDDPVDAVRSGLAGIQNHLSRAEVRTKALARRASNGADLPTQNATLLLGADAIATALARLRRRAKNMANFTASDGLAIGQGLRFGDLTWLNCLIWHVLRFDQAIYPKVEELGFQLSLMCTQVEPEPQLQATWRGIWYAGSPKLAWATLAAKEPAAVPSAVAAILRRACAGDADPRRGLMFKLAHIALGRAASATTTMLAGAAAKDPIFPTVLFSTAYDQELELAFFEAMRMNESFRVITPVIIYKDGWKSGHRMWLYADFTTTVELLIATRAADRPTRRQKWQRVLDNANWKWVVRPDEVLDGGNPILVKLAGSPMYRAVDRKPISQIPGLVNVDLTEAQDLPPDMDLSGYGSGYEDYVGADRESQETGYDLRERVKIFVDRAAQFFVCHDTVISEFDLLRSTGGLDKFGHDIVDRSTKSMSKPGSSEREPRNVLYVGHPLSDWAGRLQAFHAVLAPPYEFDTDQRRKDLHTVLVIEESQLSSGDVGRSGLLNWVATEIFPASLEDFDALLSKSGVFRERLATDAVAREVQAYYERA